MSVLPKQDMSWWNMLCFTCKEITLGINRANSPGAFKIIKKSINTQTTLIPHGLLSLNKKTL